MVKPGGRKVLDADGFSALLERQGAPASLFLAGPEILLRDEILARMRARVLGGGEETRWNREGYSARETPLSDITAGLRVVGLFAESRMVVVGEVERYGRSSQADRNDLWSCMEQPSPGIHLVLMSEKPLWELERANEFLKGALGRSEAVVRLDHPTAEQAVRIILKVAGARYDLDLPEEAAWRLVEAVGPNLLDLSHELDRLGIRLGRGKRVEPDLLEDWLRSGVVGTLADLEAALARGDVERALHFWDTVRREFSPAAVTWMLANRHLDARWSRQGRAPGPSGPILTRLLRECYRLERAIKRGEIPSSMQETAFEAMILRLCEKRPQSIQR